ncbi:hypothetical protein STEG23_018857 [Scotinomys teguina]
MLTGKPEGPSDKLSDTAPVTCLPAAMFPTIVVDSNPLKLAIALYLMLQFGCSRSFLFISTFPSPDSLFSCVKTVVTWMDLLSCMIPTVALCSTTDSSEAESAERNLGPLEP